MNWTRRSLLTSLLSYPTICAGSPLIDIENGSSMFSQGSSANFNIKRSIVKPELFNNNQEGKLNKPTAPLNKHSQLIKFTNIHTGESREIEYDTQNHLTSSDLANLDWLLRDWRENRVEKIDRRLISELMMIVKNLNNSNEKLVVNIHSGFRTLKTNKYLRQRGRKVAANSFHLSGKAVDFTIEDFSVHNVLKKARTIASGGLGNYGTFIHLDTGPVRTWVA